MPNGHWCILTPMVLWVSLRLYIFISAWGFGVARFDLQGHFLGASNREASDSAGFHAFLCLHQTFYLHNQKRLPESLAVERKDEDTMSTKFFNNNSGNTLFEKMKGIASGMATFDRFLAVVGFFRSSGYFKLRK